MLLCVSTSYKRSTMSTTGTDFDKFAGGSGYQLAFKARRSFIFGTPWKPFRTPWKEFQRGDQGSHYYINLYKLYALGKRKKLFILKYNKCCPLSIWRTGNLKISYVLNPQARGLPGTPSNPFLVYNFEKSNNKNHLKRI